MNLYRQNCFIFLFLLLSASIAQAAMFGADNRMLLTPNMPQAALGKATAIALLSGNYSVNAKGGIDLDPSHLGDLCKDEKYSQQPFLPFSCTGFLIAPDLLVTAGHCVYAINTPNQTLEHETKLACEVFKWLFDFQTDTAGQTQLKNLPANNLYGCKEIIYAVQFDKAPYSDYALIRLDRPVKDRKPFKIAAQDPSLNEKVNMIGHPFGTPLTYTNMGKVTLTNPERTSYITNLDAFEGNSGSPVLNAANEVVGILVGGTPSMNTYTDPQARCERYNRCDENGKNCSLPDKDTSVFPGFQKVGSEVQRLAPIKELLKTN